MVIKNSSREQSAGRVLVVDKDPISLKLMQDVLEQSFYEVTTCSFAQDALVLLRVRKDGFDIVFSDVNMPDMNATEFLKSVGFKMNTPIIIMSDDVEKLSLMNGVHPRPYDFLLKPIDLEKLCSIMKCVSDIKIIGATEIKSHESGEGFQDVTGVFSQHNYGIPDMADISNDIFKLDDHVIEDIRDFINDDMQDTNVFKNLADIEDHVGYASNKESTTAIKRKNSENNHDGSSAFTFNSKRTRVIWTPELHQQFITAINELHNESKKIGPKNILEKIKVPGMTTAKIASHLQKHRLESNKLQNKCHEEHQIQVVLLQPTASIARSSPSAAGVGRVESASYWELNNYTIND